MKRILAVMALGATCVAWGRIIELKTDSESCLVETRGAHILSYRIGGEELLWSPWPLQLEGTEWQHGGIPICWPAYGHDPAGLHGFAWKSEFTLVSKKMDGRKEVLTLSLENAGHRLEYQISIGNGLELTFTTINDAREPFAFSEAFHPYFLVGERDQCTIYGATPEPLVVNRALDDGFAVSLDANSARYRMVDGKMGRAIVVESENSPRMNIWNPGDWLEGWRSFVCVEPCISRRAPITLPPGKRHVMKMAVRKEGVK